MGMTQKRQCHAGVNGHPGLAAHAGALLAPDLSQFRDDVGVEKETSVEVSRACEIAALLGYLSNHVHRSES